MAERAEAVEVTKDHLVGTWQNDVLLVFKQETTALALGAVRRAVEQVAAKHEGAVFILTVVEERAPMPPSATRDAMADLLKSLARSVELSAVVHEGAGFRAAAVRSVVTGVGLVARLPFPHKVFATVTDAANWYGPNSRRTLSWHSKALIDAVAELRSRAVAASSPP